MRLLYSPNLPLKYFKGSNNIDPPYKRFIYTSYIRTVVSQPVSRLLFGSQAKSTARRKFMDEREEERKKGQERRGRGNIFRGRNVFTSQKWNLAFTARKAIKLCFFCILTFFQFWFRIWGFLSRKPFSLRSCLLANFP